jgi:Holliday junction resolvase RusA-like endonuclease
MEKKTFCSIGAPFSANEMYAPVAKGVLVKTKKYKKWIETNLPLLINEMSPANNFPIAVKVIVMAGRGFNSTTKNDIDNLKKPICDLLVRANIIPDDEKKYISKVEINYLPSFALKCEPLTHISYEEPDIVEWTSSLFQDNG